MQNETDYFYAKIPEVVIFDKEISAIAVRVFAVIWTYCLGPEHKYYLKNNVIAEQLGVSLTTIKNAMKELNDKNYIINESRGSKKEVYISPAFLKDN